MMAVSVFDSLIQAHHFARRRLLHDHAPFDCDVKQLCPLGASNLAESAKAPFQIARSRLPDEGKFHEAAGALELGPLRSLGNASQELRQRGQLCRESG